MKGADAKRAAILVDALAGFAAFEKEAKESKPRSGYSHTLNFTFGHECDSGMEHDADLSIDAVTGLKLLPLLRTLICQELDALGVKP